MDNNQPKKITVFSPTGPINITAEDLTPQEKMMLPIIEQFLKEKNFDIKKISETRNLKRK